jgi:thiol:disulfide interchange protein
MNVLATSRQQANPFKPVWGLVAILLGLCAIMAVRSYIWKDIIPWRQDFAAAAMEAQQKGEPRLLYFTSDFCDPCEQMKRTTWADSRVAAALAGYVPVKIDFLKETELDQKFGVEAIPTMIVVGSNGQVVKATTGGINAEEFLNWISGTARQSSPQDQVPLPVGVGLR